MAWFYFSQNNSGGDFDFDAAHGIGAGLMIEARDEAEAEARYYQIIDNYPDRGGDCPCCGDRWSGYGDGPTEQPERYGDAYRPANEGEAPAQRWGLPYFIHPLNAPPVAAVQVSP